jgi:tetratricopeptide (TPR) repeat protein
MNTKIRKLCVLALTGMALLSAPLSAFAQEAVPTAAKERKEKGNLMGERTFRRIESINKMYAEKEYDKAIKSIESLLGSGNLNDYEKAMASQLAGYVYAEQGKYDQAMPYFQEAVRLDALPNQAHFGMMYSLAQLYAQQGDHQKTIELLTEWFDYQADPPGQSYILMASSYAQLEQYDQALPWVRKAIASEGAKAQESWYQLELAILFEMKRYGEAATLLRGMVARWPDKLRYWEMLSGAYQEQAKDADSLAVLMAAYRHGLLYGEDIAPDQMEKKLLNVVRMNMFQDSPYVAGKILASEMAAGRIQPTQKNLELQLSAWKAAREFDQGIAVIDQLAPMTQSGELYFEKAQMLMEQNDWAGTIRASEQAIEQGNLKKPGAVYLVMGIAANELEQFDQAIQYMKKARDFDDNSRRQANDWIKFIQDRAAVAGR